MTNQCFLSCPAQSSIVHFAETGLAPRWAVTGWVITRLLFHHVLRESLRNAIDVFVSMFCGIGIKDGSLSGQTQRFRNVLIHKLTERNRIISSGVDNPLSSTVSLRRSRLQAVIKANTRQDRTKPCGKSLRDGDNAHVQLGNVVVRCVQTQASIPVEEAPNEVSVQGFGNRWVCQRGSFVWGDTKFYKFANQDDAANLTYVDPGVVLSNRPIISEQINESVDERHVLGGKIKLLSILVDRAIRGDETKHPRHFGRPGIKELLIDCILAAKSSLLDKKGSALFAGANFEVICKDMMAKRGRKDTNITGDLFHALLFIPVQVLKFINRDWATFREIHKHLLLHRIVPLQRDFVKSGGVAWQ